MWYKLPFYSMTSFLISLITWFTLFRESYSDCMGSLALFYFLIGPPELFETPSLIMEMSMLLSANISSDLLRLRFSFFLYFLLALHTVLNRVAVNGISCSLYSSKRIIKPSVSIGSVYIKSKLSSDRPDRLLDLCDRWDLRDVKVPVPDDPLERMEMESFLRIPPRVYASSPSVPGPSYRASLSQHPNILCIICCISDCLGRPIINY